MLTNLQLAFKALQQNRLQAMLTLCGMSIGVAMVVLVSGLGLGAQLQIEAQIESSGPTLITVRAGNFRPAGISTVGQQDSGGGEVSEGAVGGDEMGYSLELLENEAVRDARARQTAVRQTKARSPAWPLDADEIDLLRRGIPDIRLVAGTVAGNVTLDEAVAVTTSRSVRIARVQGFQTDWPEIENWQLLTGRLPTNAEHERGDPVMVVSGDVATRLWPAAAAIGQQLTLGGQTLSVVGVLSQETSTNNSLIVPAINLPYSLSTRLLQRDGFDEIKVRTSSVAKTTAVAKTMQASLRELRQLPEDTLDDFTVETQSVAALPSLGTDPRLARAVHANAVEFELESWEEMALSLRQAGRTFSLLLSAAAGVSLLVGGIGVMNIMLVSVAARTQEIGLRMALGARVGDVLVQFLVESVTLAALGGIIGLVIGSLGLLGAEYGLQWATAISPMMLLAAVIMAAMTGAIFGYGPARRAANLDPVVALKAE